MRHRTLSAVLMLAIPLTAWAQEDRRKDEKKAPPATPAPPPDEPPLPDDANINDNPNKPDALTLRDDEPEQVARSRPGRRSRRRG